MLVIGISAALGIAGAVGLWGLYRALEINWPEQYMSLNDTFALRITQTWWRLLLYRLVPVFIAGIAVWATTDRVHSNPALAVILMAVVHVAHTNVLAFFQSFGKLQRTPKFTVNYASYNLVNIFVVAAAAALSIVLGPSLVFIVPPPHVLLENLWIAVFITVIAGIAISVIGRRPEGSAMFNSTYFVWRAKRDIRIELLDFAYDAAIRYKADPILLRAIMFAEALQRPGWVRNLERVKGRVFKSGSYGITQEHSNSPLSDEQAIEITATRLSHAWALERTEWGWQADDGKIWDFASNHNEDVAFIKGVQEIYRSVQTDYDSYPVTSPDKELHLIEMRRYPHEFGLRAISSATRIEFAYLDTSGNTATQVLAGSVDPNEPWAFELKFPVTVKSIHVRHFGQRGGFEFDLAVPSATI